MEAAAVVEDAAVDVVVANVDVAEVTVESIEAPDAAAALVVLSSKPAAASDANEAAFVVVLQSKEKMSIYALHFL